MELLKDDGIKVKSVGKNFDLVPQNAKDEIIKSKEWKSFSYRYDNVYDFHEELACVELKGKCGFIDQKGEEIVSCKYDNVHDFYEGLAAVKLNRKYGYINQKGEEIVPCKYDGAHDFLER